MINCGRHGPDPGKYVNRNIRRGVEYTIITSEELFKAARKHNFAFLAPNYVDQISVSTHIAAAEKLGLPVILVFAETYRTYLPFDEAAAIGRFCAEKARMPVVPHLDHGQTKETVFRAIDQGFCSVMINASSQPFEENVRQTRGIVAYAHLRGAVVEAEIGHAGGGDEYKDAASYDNIYTTVEEAKRFADLTEVDFLAIPIRTAHGAYEGTPMVDFGRLAEIRNVVRTFLALHDGSSPGDENLRRYVKGGISKINIYMDLTVAAFNRAKECHASGYYGLRDAQRQGMMEYLECHYNVFGAERYLEALK